MNCLSGPTVEWVQQRELAKSAGVARRAKQLAQRALEQTSTPPSIIIPLPPQVLDTAIAGPVETGEV